MAKKTTIRFTKDALRKLPVPEDTRRNRQKGVAYHDSEVKGLRVIVRPDGSKKWQLYYRTKSGIQRWMDLGDAAARHPDAVRDHAQMIKGRVAGGDDPVEELRLTRKAALEAERAEQPKNVGDVCDEWLEHCRTRKKRPKKPKSLEMDRLYIDRYIKPAFGDFPIAELSKEQVQTLHEMIGSKGIPRKGKRKATPAPYMANRVRAVVSSVLAFAEPEYRPVGSNFVRSIEPFEERRKHRVLSELELRRLGTVLEEWPTKMKEGGTVYKGARKGERIISAPRDEDIRRRRQVVDCIRLIMATGCRKSEIAHLRWPEVDLERSVLALEDSKSGPRQVVLTKAAKEIIEQQKRAPLNPYVFPGKKPSTPLSDIKRAWTDIRAKANIGDFRMHDFRHQLGQTLADLGYSELTIGQALGHKGHSVTHVYIGVGLDVLREAMERYSETISAVVGSTG